MRQAIMVFILILLFVMQGCVEKNESVIVVYNKPLKGIVEEITRDHKVVVLVEGDIHNFQISTKKAYLLKNSYLYVGLNKEIENFEAGGKSIYMGEGKENIHYWMSANRVKETARKIAEYLESKEGKGEYYRNYESFVNKLESIEKEIREKLKGKNKKYVITHDSLYYFDREYGLESHYLFIEGQGSVKRVDKALEMFRKGEVSLLVREKQFPEERIKFFKEELEKEKIDYKEIEIDILREDFLDMYREVGLSIAENIGEE